MDTLLTPHFRREQFWMIYGTELRQIFSHLRGLHFVPLIFLGVFLIIWMYQAASPFTSVFIVVFGGLELQFNNIWFRTTRELDALVVLPTDWRRMVVLKNLATITLSVLAAILIAMTLEYFHPRNITTHEAARAFLCFSTIIFPLLCLGNARSCQMPRRGTGWYVQDFFEACWMLVGLCIVSLPYFFFAGVLEQPGFSLLYGMASALYWYRVSVPKTARHVQNEKIRLLSVP